MKIFQKMWFEFFVPFNLTRWNAERRSGISAEAYWFEYILHVIVLWIPMKILKIESKIKKINCFYFLRCTFRKNDLNWCKGIKILYRLVIAFSQLNQPKNSCIKSYFWSNMMWCQWINSEFYKFLCMKKWWF